MLKGGSYIKIIYIILVFPACYRKGSLYRRGILVSCYLCLYSYFVAFQGIHLHRRATEGSVVIIVDSDGRAARDNLFENLSRRRGAAQCNRAGGGLQVPPRQELRDHALSK